MKTEPKRDPIFDLGKDPVTSDVGDASENLDHYVYVASFLQTARSLNLDGPPDWSANVERYLYSDESPDSE
jgi:hypothetical protein